MYRQFKSRRELGRLMWKIQARRQRQDSNRRGFMSLLLQCWWRGLLAQRQYLVKLRHNIEIIPDLVERRLFTLVNPPRGFLALFSASRPILIQLNFGCGCRYYCNHNTGECTWTPPRRGFTVLHAPQDYVVALENDQPYYVKWSTSRETPHVRTWIKPPGYLRCTRCLFNLALLRCVSISGVFCFHCFRDTFDPEGFVHNADIQERVDPIICNMCSRDNLAAWRCIDNDSPSFVGIVACIRCFERLASARSWLRL